jgi:hypothetical protein
VLTRNVRFRSLLEAYLDNVITLHELRLWIAAKFPPRDCYQLPLYQPVMTHLAMYGAGEWREDDLKDAICWHLDSVDGQRPAGVPPMIDAQWMAIVASEQVPWPLKPTVPFIVRVEDGAVVAWGLELVGH